MNLFPTQVETLLTEVPELSPHYQLLVYREGTLDEAALRVELNEAVFVEIGGTSEALSQHDFVKKTQGALAQRLKDNIGTSMRGSLHAPGDLPRSEGWKLSRVLDLRKR